MEPSRREFLGGLGALAVAGPLVAVAPAVELPTAPAPASDATPGLVAFRLGRWRLEWAETTSQAMGVLRTFHGDYQLTCEPCTRKWFYGIVGSHLPLAKAQYEEMLAIELMQRIAWYHPQPLPLEVVQRMLTDRIGQLVLAQLMWAAQGNTPCIPVTPIGQYAPGPLSGIVLYYDGVDLDLGMDHLPTGAAAGAKLNWEDVQAWASQRGLADQYTARWPVPTWWLEHLAAGTLHTKPCAGVRFLGCA